LTRKKPVLDMTCLVGR